MELELGFKITKTRDDITNTTDFHIAKDRAGPLFLSKETDAMFILTGHLKGYGKNNIDVQINEDGTSICISGEKPVQEMVLKRWTMFKKEVEIRGFRKVFRIPPGVVLDRIKAKYDELESILTILLPKKVKGIRGVLIEEVKEERDQNVRLQQEEKIADEIPQKIQEHQKEKEIMDIGKKPEEMHVETSAVKREITGEIAEENEMRTETIVEKLPPVEDGNGKEAKVLHEKEYTVETLPEDSELLDVQKIYKTDVTPEVIEATAQILADEQPKKEHTPQEPDRERLDNVEQFRQVSQETPGEGDQSEPEAIAPETEVERQPIREDELKTGTDETLTTEPDEMLKDSTKEEKPEEKIEDEVKRCDEEVHAPEEAEPPDFAANEVEKQLELPKPRPKVEEEWPPSINEALLEPESQESKADIQKAEQKETPEGEQNEKAGKDGTDEIQEEVPEDKEAKEQKSQDTGSSKEKKRRPKRLCPPLVISGSALLVTLIVIVIHFFRSKKR